ncbi:MAG: DUF6498-containing protein [Candidatus Margulisiibacteriota bacterium]|jgi:hypothetical protein
MAKKFFIIDRTDPSAWSLFFANLLTIALAVKFNWSLIELMWIYWSQSVIIGAINVIKMRRLEKATGRSSWFFMGDTSSFFLMHYGFFHLIYLLFLSIFTLAGETPLSNGAPVQWGWVFITILVFLANHIFSYLYNQERDQSKANLDRLFMFPYARIIPMHLTLILGAAMDVILPGVAHAPILLFLSLKTIADLVMHKIEHS